MTGNGKNIRLLTASCPRCGAVGHIKRILWGMPSNDVDLSRFIIGGCLIDENESEVGCEQCNWVGLKKELEKK